MARARLRILSWRLITRLPLCVSNGSPGALDSRCALRRTRNLRPVSVIRQIA
jgi:hypothetical protein